MRGVALVSLISTAALPLSAQEWASATLEAKRPVYLDVAASPFKGSATAPVILIEFTDYHCPACAHFARSTLPLIDSNYIEPGWVKFIVRDFPILSLHPEAMEPAIAAHCAGEHGRYWEMHDFLLAHYRTATQDSIVVHANSIGLDSAALRTCVKKKRYVDEVRRGKKNGQSLGIRGTPAFMIAVAEPGSTKVRAVRYLYGSQPYGEFKRVLDELLLTIAGRK